MKKIVVTGATGLIGSALVCKLIEHNCEVLVLGRKSEKLDRLQKQYEIDVKHCTLEELDQVEINQKYDGFYHLAWDGTRGQARLDEKRQLKNAQYALDAVRLAKKIGCEFFVGVGSQAEYGKVKQGTKLSPQTEENPESAYGKAKLLARNESKDLCNELGIRHNWCRVLSAYGVGDFENTLVMHAINEFQKGNNCDFTPCEQEWDYLYNMDLAEGLYLIGKKGINNKTYVIGAGEARPLKDYITDIYNAVGNTDAKCNFGAIDYYPDQVMYLCADITDLHADTGFSPKIEFCEGIKHILAERGRFNEK